ncbi:hypothetical protein FUAX_11530 [Fulvitalea axinellae]|uniref:SH3b domain-containing protein n=2 Tax=Fulvitalea axinellae TaxID=1182444 RepID=A0AAU9C9B0_9BACT|nr:hypothetical protein FUAX_11530 [Fulvitalea axinellae]
MSKNTVFLGAVLAFATVFSSCGDSKKSGNEQTKEASVVEAPAEPVAEVVDAICVYDGLSLRKEPKRQGKWVSSISLGEKVTFLGDTVKEGKVTYGKVKLSDGKEGWVSDYGIVTNAKAGAVMKESPVYRRPDMLTVTQTKFNMADLVAVGEEKDGWVSVVGKKRTKKGWLRAEDITTDSKEVTAAVLLSKELGSLDGNIDLEKAQAFLENTPFKESMFVKALKEMVEQASSEERSDIEEGQEDDFEGEGEADSDQEEGATE